MARQASYPGKGTEVKPGAARASKAVHGEARARQMAGGGVEADAKIGRKPEPRWCPAVLSKTQRRQL
jgi:hypothetical protein